MPHPIRSLLSGPPSPASSAVGRRACRSTPFRRMSPVPEADAANAQGSLREVASVFLRLGCTAFGGPAAHVAMMRREMVERRHWLPEQEFLDLFGAANLIPGPSSTELAIMLGYRRAGWRALILAGRSEERRVGK